MVSYSCIPDNWVDPFAHGIAHQYLEGTPQTATTPNGVGCKGTVTDPSTGAQTCTSQCIMAAVDEPDYELINPGDVNGGVEIFHAGVAPDAGSPFGCPYDPKVGCSGSRSMTYYFTCDKNQKNGLGKVYINETSPCQYFIQATTSYACATKGDPFDPYRDNPADSFGFVVLGAFLTVVLQYIYIFGDNRNWWEPIKQRLPAIPGFSTYCPPRANASIMHMLITPFSAGGFGGKGGVYGGSSYRAVSQPIGGASPYGSTSM